MTRGGTLKSKFATAILTTTVAILGGATVAQAASQPVKLVPASHIVNGFEFPEGIAVGPSGNIYVADRGNYRVQELKPNGEFVLMFGKGVNETTGGDICTAAEKCRTGVPGGGAGAFLSPQSVSVDQETGTVYVQDLLDWRVDEYTSGGQFILTIGKEVNQTTDAVLGATEDEKNLCTAASGNVCKAGVQSAQSSTEQGAFKFSQSGSDLLAVGPLPEHLLYVGDEGRVQEFDAAGAWQAEIPLSAGCRVSAMTIEQSGNPDLACKGSDVVSEVGPDGKVLASFAVSPREAEGNTEIEINDMALDLSGHRALTATETSTRSIAHAGFLFDAQANTLITEFTTARSSGISFDGKGDLYEVSGNEVVVYHPENVAELQTGSRDCASGATTATSVTFDCTLQGAVNPFGVSGTEVWFEWGPTCALGSQTAKESIPTGNAPVPVQTVIDGLTPNQPICYRLAGEDENVKAPELLTGERISSRTPIAPPVIVGASEASFIASSSAVMFGKLNPENASTEYFFEYGPGEALMGCKTARKENCPGVSVTNVLTSALYGEIGATLEASGLQPGTSYEFRLAADNEQSPAGGTTEGGEAQGATTGAFTTAPAPVVQADTGPFTAVTTTSALISGTVDGDGQPATYTFELGRYQGATTQFAPIFSASSGDASESITIPVTGLLPSTEYAYRIRVASGYGEAKGDVGIFTTSGVPSILPVPAVLPQLAAPKVKFPTITTPRKNKTRTVKKKDLRKKHKTHKATKPRTGKKAIRGG